MPLVSYCIQDPVLIPWTIHHNNKLYLEKMEKQWKLLIDWLIDWTLSESQHDSLFRLQGDSRPMCALAYIAVSFFYNLSSNLTW